VFGEAARAAAAMPGGPDPVRVCVNLPLAPLAESQLLTFVDLMVTAGELDPGLIEIELSEADLTDDPVRAQQVINRVSSLGIRAVIDGFGTGYTSTTTLEHLQVRGIKIDRSYISTLAAVPADLVAVRATVELAHELGLSVGAEGVADGASMDLLAEVGCDFVQGFHISGPVTLDALVGRSEELERALQGWAGTLRSGHAHTAGPIRG
jgi:EAL domain-containing protein (putative c-di-GMP-specific phosphodiesterase class I)